MDIYNLSFALGQAREDSIPLDRETRYNSPPSINSNSSLSPSPTFSPTPSTSTNLSQPSSVQHSSKRHSNSHLVDRNPNSISDCTDRTLHDAMHKLSADAMANHQCLISFSILDNRAHFHLSGGYQQVMSARGQILRDNPFTVSPISCRRARRRANAESRSENQPSKYRDPKFWTAQMERRESREL